MPFPAAIKHLDTYFDETESRLTKGDRPRWFSTPLSAYSDINTLFGSSAENAEWVTLMQGPKPDINQVAGAEHKIAFLTGARMDLRKQFIAQDAQPRSSLDVRRYATMRLRWQRNNVRRLDNLVTNERSKPVT